MARKKAKDWISECTKEIKEDINYDMSKKKLSGLYSKLLYKMGNYFLDRH